LLRRIINKNQKQKLEFVAIVKPPKGGLVIFTVQTGQTDVKISRCKRKATMLRMERLRLLQWRFFTQRT
jgi:hypothetical protein